VVVRADILPGYQVAQSCHASIQWVMDNVEESRIWHDTSDYIVVLSIDNEEKLKELMAEAERKNIKFSSYREPDLDDQYTAVAFGTGKKAKSLCRGLKLALS
jgi:peptidyl-tRNA hydrolase